MAGWHLEQSPPTPWDERCGGKRRRAAPVGGGRAAELEADRPFSLLHGGAKLQILACNPVDT